MLGGHEKRKPPFWSRPRELKYFIAMTTLKIVFTRSVTVGLYTPSYGPMLWSGDSELVKYVLCGGACVKMWEALRSFEIQKVIASRTKLTTALVSRSLIMTTRVRFQTVPGFQVSKISRTVTTAHVEGVSCTEKNSTVCTGRVCRVSGGYCTRG